MRDALGSVESVLLLGGTSEIGTTTVRALVASRGASRVVLAGRDPDGLETHARQLRDLGADRVDVVEFDARALEDHAGVVDKTWSTYGDFDVVVLAFGTLGDQFAAERDPAEARRIVDTNYTGAVSAGLHVAQRLEEQGHGALVVLSSVAGERGRRSNYVYGSSKAGLDTFAQGLGDRLHASGVHVLVVRPGFVHTRMTAGLEAAPFATTPAKVARQVLRGLDRRAHLVYAPPVLRSVMLVLRNLPRAIFRRLPE